MLVFLVCFLSHLSKFHIQKHTAPHCSFTVGFQNRNESSSVAPAASAETQSILMSPHGQPDRFVWRAECSLVGAKSDEQLCRGHWILM